MEHGSNVDDVDTRSNRLVGMFRRRKGWQEGQYRDAFHREFDFLLHLSVLAIRFSCSPVEINTRESILKRTMFIRAVTLRISNASEIQILQICTLENVNSVNPIFYQTVT